MSPHIKRGLIVALLGTALTACSAPNVVSQTTASSIPTRESATITATAQRATPTVQLAATTPTAVSAPAGGTDTTPIIRDAQPQPAATPMQAVELFLTAAQHDRSGKIASFYAGGSLRNTLQDGMSDIGAVLHEQNPFQSFTIDGIIRSDENNTYVKGALYYAHGGAYDRIFTVSNREEGIWRVLKVTVPDPDPAPALSHAAATETVRRFLNGYMSQTDLKPYLAPNIRAEIEAGRSLDEVLGLHPITSFDVGAPEDRPSEVLFVPATLVYNTFSEERLFTMVVEDGMWRIFGSQPR